MWAPPLRIQPLADGVEVGVQTLGEYKTTVNRIRLTCNGHATWEVVAATKSPQMHHFTLHAGPNPCYPGDMSEPDYRVVFPDRCDLFRIQPGAACALEMWGSDSAYSRVERSIRFPE